MHAERLPLITQLQEQRNSIIIIYSTSDRSGLETQIGEDILGIFSDHLDSIGDVEKISLFLYTRGGSTLTAWSLVNLIRNFCQSFEVIVPYKCHSAGTIICLGANNVVMTKQATLGPIDPSTNGLFNPYVEFNGQRVKAPVSVEHVHSYTQMLKNEFNIDDPAALGNIIVNLSNHIHPIALGEVFKSKSQIQMIAKKLLRKQGIEDAGQVDKIINFLVSESGSHDYTIYRREAHEELGLNIEKPTMEIYSLIKAIYKDLENELQLTQPYDPQALVAGAPAANYSLKRGVIESIVGGCHVYLSEGTLTSQVINVNGVPNTMLNDSRTFEGWRKIV
jgi:hypothetical protein